MWASCTDDWFGIRVLDFVRERWGFLFGALIKPRIWCHALCLVIVSAVAIIKL